MKSIKRNRRNTLMHWFIKLTQDANGTGEEVYCIDAAHKGDLSRFFNHSCSPNMV